MARPRPAIARFPDNGVLDRAMEDIYAQLGDLSREVVQQMIDAAFEEYEPDSGDELVDRGDPASYDWTEASLTSDSTWRDLDLSSIVPEGTRWVLLGVILHYGEIRFREDGNSNAINRAQVTDRNEDVAEDVTQDVWVAVKDQTIEYWANSGGGAYSVDIVVRGWVI